MTHRALLSQLCAQPLHDSDRARILFQPVKGSKVPFKHSIYTLAESWKSLRNLCKLLHSPLVICTLLIVNR